MERRYSQTESNHHALIAICPMTEAVVHLLKIKDLGIGAYRENIIFIRADNPICLAEGLTALTRVLVHQEAHHIVATINLIHSDLLAPEEVSLSQEAMKRLGVREGDMVSISHLQPIDSLKYVRAKIYGREIDEQGYREIMRDLVAGYYANIELSAFVAACSGDNLSLKEITYLTKAMIEVGETMTWEGKMIFDKHCVGGLPGNRTTPIIVSIAAAAGLVIPKTSSRAITSPAGTSDTMETMTAVNLSVEQIQAVVAKTGGCFAWGGAVNLSPADDLLIAIERSLDIDSTGQMVASVLSKKAAAGSTHVVIDIPVGPTAKVRTYEEALKLQYYFKAVSESLQIHVEVVITDGAQPVGRGIGPSLEAMDVLAVLRNNPDAPADLKERAILLSAALLKLSGKYAAGTEFSVAKTILESGVAYQKFMEICLAQGSFKEPSLANYAYRVLADKAGTVTSVDNRKLARIAKLAGAPGLVSAGVLYHAPLGAKIEEGDLLFTIYAESQGELDYAKAYLNSVTSLISIE